MGWGVGGWGGGGVEGGVRGGVGYDHSVFPRLI